MIKLLQEHSVEIAGETYIRFPVLEFLRLIDTERLRIAYKGKIIKGYNIQSHSLSINLNKYRIDFSDGDGNGYVEELIFEHFLQLEDDNDYLEEFLIYEPKDDMTKVYFRKSDLQKLGLLPDDAEEIMPSVVAPPPGPDVTDAERKAFVKLIGPDVLKVYRVVSKLDGKEALDAAVTFLEKNPCQYIPHKSKNFTETMFPNVTKPDRAFKGHLVNFTLVQKGHKPMCHDDIIKILAE